MTLRIPAGARRRVAAFDKRIDSLADRLRGHRAADRVFYGASAVGEFSLIWFALTALRGLRSPSGWEVVGRIGIGIAAESAIVNLGIKSLFQRDRPPWEVERPRRLRRPRTSSFPSGHATSSFAAAMLLSTGDSLWPLYFAIAAVVASSRVYVKIHHASDVVVGVVLGLALGAIGVVVLDPGPAY